MDIENAISQKQLNKAMRELQHNPFIDQNDLKASDEKSVDSSSSSSSSSGSEGLDKMEQKLLLSLESMSLKV